MEKSGVFVKGTYSTTINNLRNWSQKAILWPKSHTVRWAKFNTCDAIELI